MEATTAPVITLCGSTKFKDDINAENARLTMEGNVVISLGLFGHTDLPDYNWDTDVSSLKRLLDGLHFQKIDMADRVHVVNPGGYIGESTSREIDYAIWKGKVVTFMTDENRPCAGCNGHVHAADGEDPAPGYTCPDCMGSGLYAGSISEAAAKGIPPESPRSSDESVVRIENGAMIAVGAGTATVRGLLGPDSSHQVTIS